MTPRFKVGDRVEYIAFPGDRGRVHDVDVHNSLHTGERYAYYTIEWPDDPEADGCNMAYEWELMPSVGDV